MMLDEKKRIKDTFLKVIISMYIERRESLLKMLNEDEIDPQSFVDTYIDFRDLNEMIGNVG